MYFHFFFEPEKKKKEKHKNIQIYSLISVKRRRQPLVNWWSDSWNFDYLLSVSSRHLRGNLFHIAMAIAISTCLKNSSLSSLFSSFAEIVLFSINFHLVHETEGDLLNTKYSYMPYFNENARGSIHSSSLRFKVRPTRLLLGLRVLVTFLT